MFRMAGQTAGPIETKLETRTHVHPWSVSGKVDVKVIHVCVREWQKYETPGKRHLANGAHATSGRNASEMTYTVSGGALNSAQPQPQRPDDGRGDTYRTITKRCWFRGRVTRRGAAGAEQRAPMARAELRQEDG